MRPSARLAGGPSHLLESVHGLLALAEMFKEQLQGAGDKRGVVVHGQVQQDSQEHPATFIIHLEHAAGLPVSMGGHEREPVNKGIPPSPPS